MIFPRLLIQKTFLYFDKTHDYSFNSNKLFDVTTVSPGKNKHERLSQILDPLLFSDLISCFFSLGAFNYFLFLSRRFHRQV